LLAFSSSSSGATLPVTMKRCEEKLGISKETSSFVLPLGATINMDGTALYQAVATVFIGQVMLDVPFSLATQVNIVLLTVLASIGTAAVPGAGMVMLIIILEGVWPADAAVTPVPAFLLIITVDRILDMCRTAVNVTGDATVATIIAHSEKQLNPPD
jgi:Na+/H+-dicarboxylate symporter